MEAERLSIRCPRFSPESLKESTRNSTEYKRALGENATCRRRLDDDSEESGLLITGLVHS